MDTEELRTFIAVANAASFSKAAEALHVVQSTVSNRIRALEDYTGVQLLIRDKTGIRLTNAGSTFLKYAKQMTELDSSALRDIHAAEAFTDSFRVASVAWLSSYALAPILASFSMAHPEIAVDLTVAHGEEIIPKLREQIYDCALISYNISNASFVSFPFNTTKVVLVGEKERFGHLAGGVAKEDLKKLPVIYSDIWENYLSAVTDEELQDHLPFPIRTNALEFAKTFAVKGAGCCFLPELMVRRELKEGQLIRIPVSGVPVKSVKSYLIYSKRSMESGTVKMWMDHVFKEMNDLNIE